MKTRPMKTYTFETFGPDYRSPVKHLGARLTTLHRGSAVDNYGSMAPTMINYREFSASSDTKALKQARAASRIMGYKFIGFVEDAD